MCIRDRRGGLRHLPLHHGRQGQRRKEVYCPARGLPRRDPPALSLIHILFESDRYRQYLATMSRFHRYSVNNTMLIYMPVSYTHLDVYKRQMLVMLPFFLLAMYEKNGQPPEKLIRNIVQVCFLRPKQRPYSCLLYTSSTKPNI